MDLNAPLGMTPPPPRQRPWTLVVVLTLVVLACTGIGAYLVTADPNGGEPFATAAIPPPPPKSAAVAALPATTDPTPTGSLAAAAPSAKTAAEAENRVRTENGVRIVSPLAATARSETINRGPLVIDVSKALDSEARKPMARPAPELHANAQPQTPLQATAVGRTALDRAQATPVFNSGGSQPRVAIFIGGLGLSDAATRTAIEITPPAVSLAFVPYGDKIAASVGDAKRRGHEILLQLPMQGPHGAPPGPHALRADEPTAEMAADLDWLTSRFEGYAGATNLLGADVTADNTAMRAILGRLGQRNLFYVDDGTSKRSVAPNIAGQLGVSTVRADVVLDATGDPAMVRANLERLVAIAKTKGTAIGVASGLSDHLALVARFAGDLAGRGIVLVPVGTLVHDGASIATAR